MNEISYPSEVASAHGDVIRAARKFTRHRLTGHARSCVGPLSDNACECGFTDLAFALVRLDALSDSHRTETG